MTFKDLSVTFPSLSLSDPLPEFHNNSPLQLSDPRPQLAWADTYMVGCGYTYYDDPKRGFSKLYVCNYGPGGNLVGGSMYRFVEYLYPMPAYAYIIIINITLIIIIIIIIIVSQHGFPRDADVSRARPPAQLPVPRPVR